MVTGLLAADEVSAALDAGCDSAGFCAHAVNIVIDIVNARVIDKNLFILILL
jgi:hypothetical protein